MMETDAIDRFSDGYWEWFRRGKASYEIAGKYLFFSTDRDLLVTLATEELNGGTFHLAKIPMPGMHHHPEYVLCLYYEDDSRKRELAAKYGGQAGLKYRYWKSDEATSRGEYSAAFLDSLPSEVRERFEGGQ